MKEAIIVQGRDNERKDEDPFHSDISDNVAADLKQLLTAIDAYEAFGRAITDAFDGLRYCASSNGGAPVNAGDFSSTKAAKSALAALGTSLLRIHAHPTLLEWERDQKGLAQAVERFDGVRTSGDLFDAVLNHHEHVQRDRPPH